MTEILNGYADDHVETILALRETLLVTNQTTIGVKIASASQAISSSLLKITNTPSRSA